MINTQADITMGRKGFGGKKAAPFVKGGGRKKSHTHTARGTKRKRGK